MQLIAAIKRQHCINIIQVSFLIALILLFYSDVVIADNSDISVDLKKGNMNPQSLLEATSVRINDEPWTFRTSPPPEMNVLFFQLTLAYF